MLANGAEIGRDFRREQRHFVLLAEQIKGFLADREAAHLCLSGPPKYVGDRKASRQRDYVIGDAFGQVAALFQKVVHEHGCLLLCRMSVTSENNQPATFRNTEWRY